MHPQGSGRRLKEKTNENNRVHPEVGYICIGKGGCGLVLCGALCNTQSQKPSNNPIYFNKWVGFYGRDVR